MNKALRLFIISWLLLQSSVAFSGHDQSEHARHPNPERRGIGTRSNEEVRMFSGKHKPIKITILPRKSLIVTDVEILKDFTFDELMERLVEDSGSPTLTKEKLFQQWWDTANRKDRFNLGLGGPNCDSPGKDLNGFPYTCPRDEGDQVLHTPFGSPTPQTYTAIALVNRFDLADAPRDAPGYDCGEYRIVFERNSGINVLLNRNLLIFEGVLRNPHPKKRSLAGCLPVQKFWAELSAPSKSIKERAKLLHDFFYEKTKVKDSTGLREKGFDAVVRAKNFGMGPKEAPGQVRTNQFMTSVDPPNKTGHAEWLLREFHIVKDSSMGLRFVPQGNAVNPPALLFNETDNHPMGQKFRKTFLNHLGELNKAIKDLKLDTPDEFDSGDSESTESPSGPMDYLTAFESSPQFKKNIEKWIHHSGSKLTAEDMVKRAQTQSCAGCHRLSSGANLGGDAHWPKSLGFTHIELADPEDNGPDGKRYKISDALGNATNGFLLHRKENMENFLKGPRNPQ